MQKKPKAFYLNIALSIFAVVLIINALTPKISFIKRAIAAVASITGQGTPNYLGVFANAGNPTNQIGDSKIFQDGTGNIGLGTTNPSAKLDVNGDIAIGGTDALRRDGVNAYLFPWSTGYASNNVIVGGGATTNMQVTGTLNANGDIHSGGTVYAAANGTKYLCGGDDACLYDVNGANTVGVEGAQDSSQGNIQLGSNGSTITGHAASNYGSSSIYGSKNGWAGINFPGNGTLMMNGGTSGFFNAADNGWTWYVDNNGTQHTSAISFPDGSVQTTAATPVASNSGVLGGYCNPYSGAATYPATACNSKTGNYHYISSCAAGWTGPLQQIGQNPGSITYTSWWACIKN